MVTGAGVVRELFSREESGGLPLSAISYQPSAKAVCRKDAQEAQDGLCVLHCCRVDSRIPARKLSRTPERLATVYWLLSTGYIGCGSAAPWLLAATVFFRASTA